MKPIKSKPSKSRRSIPIEKLILLLAAGFAAYNFGLAGGYVEGTKFSAGGLIADLAIVLAGAVSGKGLIALSEESAPAVHADASQSSAGAGGAAKTANKKSQSAKAATDSTPIRRTYPRKCDHCTEMLRSANAVGAHMKKHHPELCKPKTPLAVGLFNAPVTASETIDKGGS